MVGRATPPFGRQSKCRLDEVSRRTMPIPNALRRCIGIGRGDICVMLKVRILNNGRYSWAIHWALRPVAVGHCTRRRFWLRAIRIIADGLRPCIDAPALECSESATTLRVQRFVGRRERVEEVVVVGLYCNRALDMVLKKDTDHR